MHWKDLPQRWLTRLELYTDEKHGTDYAHRGKLGASDFGSGLLVRIGFPDRSKALFHSAFFIAAPEWNEVALFTEHCGYHIFPLYELEIELIDATRTSSVTET